MYHSFIGALAIIALISGQVESIRFGKAAPALALPLPEPAPQYLAPVAAAPLPAASYEAERLASTKGGAAITATREINYGIKGAAPLPVAAAPLPAPAPAVITQQYETRYAPVAPAYAAPPAQPLTYIYLRPMPQQYSYHLGQIRYAELPPPPRPLLAPEYLNREVYRELTPLPAAAPILLPPPGQTLIRETALDAPDLGAIKASKLAKLKSSIERALGLLSFNSYHVAKEEQFLPPPPVTLLQPAIIEQQREQHIVQEQENTREIEQHQEQIVREQTKQADLQQQQLPIQQQNEVRESYQSPSNRNLQQQNQLSSDVDSSGFKRSSPI